MSRFGSESRLSMLQVTVSCKKNSLNNIKEKIFKTNKTQKEILSTVASVECTEYLHNVQNCPQDLLFNLLVKGVAYFHLQYLAFII